MMPDPMQGGPGVPVGPGPRTAPPGAPGAPGGGPSPDEVKSQLVQLLTEAKKIADQNGVNFSEVVAQVENNKVKSDRPLPRPPKPPGMP